MKKPQRLDPRIPTTCQAIIPAMSTILDDLKRRELRPIQCKVNVRNIGDFLCPQHWSQIDSPLKRVLFDLGQRDKRERRRFHGEDWVEAARMACDMVWRKSLVGLIGMLKDQEEKERQAKANGELRPTDNVLGSRQSSAEGETAAGAERDGVHAEEVAGLGEGGGAARASGGSDTSGETAALPGADAVQDAQSMGR